MNFLQKIAIKSKLRLLVCLPVLFLVGVLAADCAEKYRTMRQAAALKELAAIARLTTELAHEAQKERGMTSGFLGSKGKKFNDRLPGQRTETDKRLAALADFLAHSKTDKLVPALSAKMHEAFNGIDKIASVRQQADTLSILWPQRLSPSIPVSFMNFWPRSPCSPGQARTRRS